MESRKEIIQQKLSVLNPHILEIIDQSANHVGHFDNHNNGESHFLLKIKADQLNILKSIEQHRLINDLLKDEFNKGLHALSIVIIK
ncbi:MAG: BolA family transcriptional regulator [Rickettsiales bacterium]|nr:MAG: BolA family transcriptional regulator [Rickettsiales bacterium]